MAAGLGDAGLAVAASLDVGHVLEADVVSDAGRRQGTGLLMLSQRARACAEGRVARALSVGYSDEYYAWWATTQYGAPGDPAARDFSIHFCSVAPA